jgi:hypothetical protein
MTWVARVAREVFRREVIPTRLLWWFVAEGTCEWLHLLRRELSDPLGGRDRAGAIIAELARPMFARRYAILRAAHPGLPDLADEPRALGLVMGGLYRTASNRGETWLFEPLGGAPHTFAEHARAEALLRGVPLRARWEEVTNHLGELLVALTEGLPRHMDRARPVLGEICFRAGLHFGRKIKKAFALGDAPAEALECLRMSEYVFRVNPEHWGKSDPKGRTGYLEGTACPWFTAPGWNGAHCGIFGQFQSGISAVYGLRYHLTTTIPKHGGSTCRIDVKPIPLQPKPRMEAR